MPSCSRRTVFVIAIAGFWPAASWAAGEPAPRALEPPSVSPAPERKPNRLAHEKSPYLLQHAYNPVDWYPWGEEAFAKAKRENKPIFLSIGYSTCYWCHVMEKESFEDAEVAKLMNDSFVAIKVDREERPDIDEQYMLATQLVTGSGGWPNTLWLTPEGQPWMAGTYFPKAQLMSALKQLADVWKNRRADAVQQAAALAKAIADAGSAPVPSGIELTPKLVEQAVTQLANRFDPRNGGMVGAPKFPPHGALELLIRHYRDTGDQALLTPITKTLDAMWLGGMHDHIGGGFHRYSTDAQWLLPHFEKMLYDNAQLMRNYTDGYLVSGKPRYRDAVEDIFRWVQREMTSPQGAFYSAIDSGEVGKEGETYIWRQHQIEDVLGKDDAALFAKIYNFEQDGNFTEQRTGERTGANIPHLVEPLENIAQQRKEDPAAFAARIAKMRDQLLARRLTWPQPHKDDKVLTGWNGLMIGSLAYAGRQLHEPRYTAAATRAADFILRTMLRDGTLLRSYRDNEAKLPGYLDDYAYFAQGLIELYRATGEKRWLEAADQLAARLVNDFQDKQNGGFYFTTAQHENLMMRSKSLGGGGNLPDANGVAAEVLLNLASLANHPAYLTAAKRTLTAMAGLMQQNPFSTEHLLLATAELLHDPAPSLMPAPAVAATDQGAGEASPDLTRRAGPVSILAYASRLSARPGETLQVAVALDIDDGWHLYGQNPAADFLVPTTLSLESSTLLVSGQVAAPEPHRAVDAILKQTLNTYSGRIWFRVPVTVNADARAGATTLTLSVKTQACDASRCLSPETTLLRIPLQIDSAAPAQTRHPGIFGVVGEAK
jgi:uncharacterized protein YyaL (SSP411 family)